MSAIGEIYLAIANLQLGGIVSRNLPDVQLEVEQADLPLRLLVPSTRGEGEFVAIGSLEKVTWTLRDLCLWAPLASGKIEDVAAPMMEYVKAYVEALKALRSPTAASVITGFTFQLTPQPWGEADYWAVDVTLTVEEWL